VLKVKVHPPTRRVKFGGDWRWGGEKVACWSTKATISLKRVNVAEKLLWRACMNSPTLFRTVPSQTSYGLLFPKIGVRNPTQNPNIAIISGVGEVTAYGLQIWLEHSQGISEHKPVGIFSDCPDFWVPPIISGTGKATNFKFCTHIHSFIRKSTLKISGKVPVGVVRNSRNFSGHSCMRRIARSSSR